MVWAGEGVWVGTMEWGRGETGSGRGEAQEGTFGLICSRKAFLFSELSIFIVQVNCWVLCSSEITCICMDIDVCSCL